VSQELCEPANGMMAWQHLYRAKQLAPDMHVLPATELITHQRCASILISPIGVGRIKAAIESLRAVNAAVSTTQALFT